MKILIVTNAYKPIINSASMLMGDLAHCFRTKGHDVYVLTKYPKGFDEGKKIQEFTRENGINVIRIKVPPVNMVNYIRRGINTIIYPWILYHKSKKFLKHIDFDVMILYAPPIQLAKTIKLYKQHNNAKTVLILRDIFPQNAIDLGILKNKLLIKYFEDVEYNAYQVFDLIATQLKENKEHLIKEKGVEASKVDVIYNWIDIQSFDEEVKDCIDYKSKYRLEDKIVCLFGGTIGPAQGLDFLLEVANQMVNVDKLCFLIIGDGKEKIRLQEKAKSMNLDNVIFKDFIPNNEFNMLVKSCDIGLINLSDQNKTSIIPGKILSFMAASIPIMGAANKESQEFKSIINDNECGYIVNTGDIQTYIKFLTKLARDEELRNKMGRNGRKYLENNFSVNHVEKKIENSVC